MKIHESTPIDQSELPMVLTTEVLEDILGVIFLPALVLVWLYYTYFFLKT